MKTRTLDIRIRVNTDEKVQVQELAQAAGLTVSDFIRQRLGLDSRRDAQRDGNTKGNDDGTAKRQD